MFQIRDVSCTKTRFLFGLKTFKVEGELKWTAVGHQVFSLLPYNDYDAFNCGIVASESAQSSTPYSLQFAVH